MTGTPKSYRAMLIAVAAANHPEIDGTDKALLNVLGINADAKTGKNARPGNAALLAATGIKWSALHERINRNISRGLIECTFKARGKGMASEYRLRLENPAYPDRSTTGELLIDEPESPESGPASVRPEPDSSNPHPSGLNRTDDSRTVRPDSANRPAQATQPSGQKPQPSGAGTQPSGLDRTTSKNSSNISSKNSPKNSHTSANLKSKSVGVCVEEPYDQVMRYIHDDMRASQWKKGEQEQLRNLIAKHGWETVVAVEHLYWQEQDATFFARTAFKWTALIAAFSGWADKVTPEMLKSLAHERWKKTPEGKAHYERQIAELIRRERERHIAMYGDDNKRAGETFDWHEAIDKCLAGEAIPAPQEMYSEDMDCWSLMTVKRDGKEYTFTRDGATGNLVCEESGNRNPS